MRLLRGSYGRALFAVLAIGLATAGVSANEMVADATSRAFAEILDTAAGRVALQVTGGDGVLFPAALAASIGQLPDVTRAIPVVSGSAFPADGDGELLNVQAVDLTDQAVAEIYDMQTGPQETGLDDPKLLLPDSVVLTHSFADPRRLSLGSSITLDTPAGQHRFTVRGLLEPTGIARLLQGNLIVMDIEAAQDLFARPGKVNRIDLVIPPGRDLRRVRAAVSAILPEGLKVYAPGQRRADLNKVIRAFRFLLSALDLVSLTAGFLIAFNGLSTLFERRAWQIGVLRAIGVREGQVRRELLTESLLIGIAGVVVGLPMAVVLAHILVPMITASVAITANISAPKAALVVRPVSLTFGGVMALLAAMLAGGLPAWRAAREEIVATVRLRGVEQRGGGRVAPQLLSAGIGLASAAALVMQVRTHATPWGLAATGLITIVAALAARPLTDLVRGRAGRLAMRVAGPVQRFALAHVAQSPRRTSLTVAVLGVGLGAVLWLWIVAQSFEQSVVSVLGQAIHADLSVGSTHIASGFIEAPMDERFAEKLKTVPGISSIAAERLVDAELEGATIAIDAYDPPYFADSAFGRWPLLDQRSPDIWPAMARGEAVIVSSNFLLNAKQRLRDDLTLDTPSGPLRVQIAGLATHFGSSGGTVIMSRALYQRYWHDPQVTRFLVRAQPGVDVAHLRTTILKSFGRDYGLQVITSAELVDYFADRVAAAFSGLYILAGLVLYVVIMGMSDTLAASVIERTREIGALRTIGVRRREIQRIIVAESLLLGGLGLLLALAFGIVLGSIWVWIVYPYLFGWILELHFPFAPAIRTALMAFGGCFVSAYLPARQAAALEAADALRYE